MTFKEAFELLKQTVADAQDPELHRRPGGGRVHSVIGVSLENRLIHANAEALRLFTEGDIITYLEMAKLALELHQETVGDATDLQQDELVRLHRQLEELLE